MSIGLGEKLGGKVCHGFHNNFFPVYYYLNPTTRDPAEDVGHGKKTDAARIGDQER
jgi:hypothetical protein